MRILCAIVICLNCWIGMASAQPMQQNQLHQVIATVTSDLRVEDNLAVFSYNGVQLYCISDVRFDRMRIIAPIGDYKGVPESQKDILLAANYHSALDARYAVSDGILYSAFIHPLSTLTPEQVASAIRQVSTLVVTFGDTYTSGELSFGGEN